MNYKVLYRKYRPDGFESLVGQNHVVNILKNSIKEQKIAHAYLFSGPRGTGKTSTARILAKSINCINNQDGLACNECVNCESFNSNPDIIEIDAASNNGVDEIRELINNVKIMPTSLKYKVYIIDEVHMLSQSAFNALLLTLEEPPEHVIFILATTNLESVPITIVSRCQRFDFRKISNKEILARLKYVCGEEKIDYDEEGLKEIASLADGGLRDALSILDQLSKNNEKITSEIVDKEIGSISNKKILSLVTALDNNDISKIEDIFDEFQNSNLNYKVIIKKIIYILSDVAVEIFKGTSKWHMSFDTCKKLIFDLNNLINKININVDAYLLIKMTFLSYVDNSTFEEDVIKLPKKETEKMAEENAEEKDTKKLTDSLEEKISKIKKAPVQSDQNEKLIDIRINNCFVEASKKYLTNIKTKWEEFTASLNNSAMRGLISDTVVVTASNKYAILVTQIKHKDMEINAKIKDVETSFNDYLNANYNLIFISEDKWNIEKQKYIENLKNKYTYSYINEEDIKTDTPEDDTISSVADVFDINKIEVE